MPELTMSEYYSSMEVGMRKTFCDRCHDEVCEENDNLVDGGYTSNTLLGAQTRIGSNGVKVEIHALMPKGMDICRNCVLDILLTRRTKPAHVVAEGPQEDAE